MKAVLKAKNYPTCYQLRSLNLIATEMEAAFDQSETLVLIQLLRRSCSKGGDVMRAGHFHELAASSQQGGAEDAHPI